MGKEKVHILKQLAQAILINNAKPNLKELCIFT